jgi:long-chain fatty acid transport protein
MMKKSTFKRIGLGITLSILTSTLLHATNGDHLIAVGTKARGMGGVGIAMSHGAETTLNNPAMITSVLGTEISFGGTLFMPDISAASYPGAPVFESDADINVIPEVSIAHKINDNWYIGVGMWGTAGMGVDYRDANVPMDMNNMNMVTNLQLMQFGVPIAYKMNGLSLAVTPILQYGSLDINYKDQSGDTVGDGVAQDLAFGYSLGLAYDFSNGLTLGAVYKSAIEMDYSNQLSVATAPMGITMDDKLEQPAEIGVGIAYKMNQHTFAFDYKQIKWSDAKGYDAFGWEDQDVYAFGYEYAENNWAVRAGFNYAENPIASVDPRISTFNILGFPATAEQHYTVGGSYGFTDSFSLDLAYVYAPETETTLVGIAGPATVYHTENSLSFQLTYKF